MPVSGGLSSNVTTVVLLDVLIFFEVDTSAPHEEVALATPMGCSENIFESFSVRDSLDSITGVADWVGSGLVGGFEVSTSSKLGSGSASNADSIVVVRGDNDKFLAIEALTCKDTALEAKGELVCVRFFVSAEKSTPCAISSPFFELLKEKDLSKYLFGDKRLELNEGWLIALGKASSLESGVGQFKRLG